MTRWLWRLCASERSTAVLILLLSAAPVLSILLPQGSEAIELAQNEHATRLHTLITWGLSDIYGSPWIKAVGALLLVNLSAYAYAVWYERTRSGELPPAPAHAPLEERIEAERPEASFDALRAVLFPRIGRPRAERVDGDKLEIVFDSGLGPALAPLLSHLGLFILVFGAGTYSRDLAPEDLAPRARLLVQDSRTGTSGVFDMVAGEPFQFFQWPTRYVLRSYAASRGGLGPAVQLEQLTEGQERGIDLWVYQDAPRGFDARHRQGQVGIDALEMGLYPRPGSGLPHASSGPLLVFGLALSIVGAFGRQRASGRLWISIDGRDVRLAGVPHAPGDPDFAARFDRWALTARAVLEPRPL